MEKVRYFIHSAIKNAAEIIGHAVLLYCLIIGFLVVWSRIDGVVSKILMQQF